MRSRHKKVVKDKCLKQSSVPEHRPLFFEIYCNNLIIMIILLSSALGGDRMRLSLLLSNHVLRQSSNAAVIYCSGHPFWRLSTALVTYCNGHVIYHDVHLLWQSPTATATYCNVGMQACGNIKAMIGQHWRYYTYIFCGAKAIPTSYSSSIIT